MTRRPTAGTVTSWRSCTWRTSLCTGSGIPRTARRTDSVNRNAAPGYSGSHSLSCRGRRWRTPGQSLRLLARRFWSMGGVSTVVCKIAIPTNISRWKSSQDPLHLRFVLRTELGLDHRIQQPVPVVLPGLLRVHDQPPCTARHPALPDQVRRSVGGVRATGTLPVHSCKLSGSLEAIDADLAVRYLRSTCIWHII